MCCSCTLTGDGTDHGESSEGSCQSLSAHDGCRVGRWQESGHPKQTSLKNRSERWDQHNIYQITFTTRSASVSLNAFVVRVSQLMQMILIMVMMKNGSGSKSTFTRMAVSRNTTRMAVRLPAIRIF